MRFATALVLSWGTAALLAFPAAAEGISEFRLGNGMDVVVIEDHRAPVVVHMVWYRTGAADEAEGTSGVAHFLEHLMFKGTDDLAPGEFTATVEALGGNDNAFTSWDYTAYFQRVSADHLGLMMQMEADRMRDLILSEEDVATEREVILEERSQRTDGSPSAMLGEQMNAALYLNHPYGNPVIGWRHEMEALTRDTALEYYRAYYAPNNAVLIVAGDVTPDQVKALAEQHYGPLQPSDAIVPRDRVDEPPQVAERRVILQDERVSEPYVSRSYHAPERNAGDQKQAAALTLLAELLGGNATTSVLARKLQFESQVAVYSTAFYDGTSVDQTAFGVVVMPGPDQTLESAEAALDQVLADFLKEGIDDQDFARLKTQVRASEIYALDNTEGRARRIGEALAVGLTLADVEDWPKVLNAVTKDEVMEAARSVLNRKASVTGWLMPQEEPAQ